MKKTKRDSAGVKKIAIACSAAPVVDYDLLLTKPLEGTKRD